jgi:flagellar FliL protein
MASKSAAPDPAATPAPPKSKKLLIFIVIGVAVLALVATGALLLLKKNKKANEEGADDEEPAKVELDKKHPPVFVPMEPFTVNLQPENGEQYLQIVLSLQMSDAKTGEEVKAYTPEIRHRILMLLSGKKASEIATTEGRENLAKEIRGEANAALGYEPKASKKKKAADGEEDASGGPVIEVFFTSFIVQ